MRKIAILISLGLFLTIFLFSCKKNNGSALIANWRQNDTINNVTTNLALNITDNSHYNFNAIVSNTVIGSDTGTYSASSYSVTFTSTNATSPCIGIPGSYSYSIAGNDLILTGPGDSCYYGNKLRSNFLASGIWTK